MTDKPLSLTERFAIRILPRNEIVEPSLSRRAAEAYVETFNRVMADSGVSAEMVRLSTAVSLNRDRVKIIDADH